MKVFLVTVAALGFANLFACATQPPIVVESAGSDPVQQTVPADAPTQVLAQADPRTQPVTPSVADTVAQPLPATAPVIVTPSETASTSVVDTPAARQLRFDRWKADFAARMDARHGSVAGSIVRGAELQDQLLDRDTTQPEFTRPVWSYLDSALKDSRVRPGRESLSVYGPVFDRIEARYNVPRETLTAIWGMESQYGTIMGDNDVVSALATFAFEGRRADMFTNQLEALVDLVADGKLRREDLLGSWAGAMGMTQFMPATLRDYAVDFDGNGVIELRSSEADALGSAAHYLSRFGWVPDQPAMVEVTLPQDFDYGLADASTQRNARDWQAMGVRAVGTALPDADAKLMLPAGAKGPAFLTFKNFDVIKRYNNSTSYAMAIAGLAQTFEGTTPVVRDWPRDDQPLSFDDKMQLQERLLMLGYDPNGVDGVIGPGTRKAVRAWQAANGLPADGYVEQTLFRRIIGG